MLSTLGDLKKRGLNPTNGSWWMVQILSKGSEVSTHCREWDYIEFGEACSRKDLNEPPTAVGGITLIQERSCRKDLNRTTHCRGWSSGEATIHVSRGVI